jgi:hypothetical protein
MFSFAILSIFVYLITGLLILFSLTLVINNAKGNWYAQY